MSLLASFISAIHIGLIDILPVCTAGEMSWFQAIILAIVQGLTEFLPISSTGHMVITSSIMGIETAPFTKLFEVVVQFGTIISVVVLYWKRFFDFSKMSFYIKLLIAVIPALIFGKLLKSHIDNLLEKPLIIAVVMLAGGIVLIFVDSWFNKPQKDKHEEVTNKNALVIGLFQVLSIVFPGLSRSAATIIGGMQQKLSRRLAAEFSFFLAVPTMFAATAASLYDAYRDIPALMQDSHNIILLILGCVVAFIVAIIVIKIFIAFLQKSGFKVFGYYRIVVGLTIIILYLFGIELQMF